MGNAAVGGTGTDAGENDGADPDVTRALQIIREARKKPHKQHDYSVRRVYACLRRHKYFRVYTDKLNRASMIFLRFPAPVAAKSQVLVRQVNPHGRYGEIDKCAI